MCKKIICLVSLTTAVIILLSSCTGIETVELNRRLIIEAVGIDSSEGAYEVTIEGLDSFAVGNDTSSVSSESLTRCYYFKGNTIGMAMNQISARTGLIPLFSQARVLVIGKETAEKELEAVLDFFRREYTTRTDILIAVAETSAKEVLSADFGKSISAGKIIATALDSGRYTGRSIYMPLYKFLNALSNETDAAFCPFVGTKKDESSQLYEVRIMGTAVYFNNRSTVLDSDETLALSVFLNKTENGDFTINTDKGICTLEIIDCDTSVETNIENGKIFFSVTNILICDIPELLAHKFSSLSADDTEKIAYASSELLAKMQTEILQKYYYEQNFDIFNLGRRINLRSPSLYSQYIKDIDDVKTQVVCDITTRVSIRRIGKILLENNQ